jgi:hypothetical protein
MNNRTSLHTDILAMNISWLHEDLELFENSFDLTTSLVFTLARFITLILAIIVHRAFYRLMKRLPGRAVNTLIYPYMVSYQESVLFKRDNLFHYLMKIQKIKKHFLTCILPDYLALESSKEF